MGNQPECPAPFPGVTELGKNDLAKWESREYAQGKAAHPDFKKTFIGKVKWKQQKSSWTQSFKKQNREGRKVRAAVQKHQNAQLLLSKVAGRCLELLPSWRQGWAVEAHSPSSTSSPPSEFSSRASISTPKEILKLWQSQNQSKGNRKWNSY